MNDELRALIRSEAEHAEAAESLAGAGLPSTPPRRRIILELAQADGQPWTDDQAASGWTDHMGEVMYGNLANIVLASAEEAWSEGQYAGAGHVEGEWHQNPYRAEVAR